MIETMSALAFFVMVDISMGIKDQLIAGYLIFNHAPGTEHVPVS